MANVVHFILANAHNVRMAQLAIVNAPSSFTTIWGFIKPWLAKETVAKVDILGKDYQEQLLKLVDADSLPASLGGKCTCEGLGGCEKSNAGPWSLNRKERREKWLRGEGDIALGAGDLEVVADRSVDGEQEEEEVATSHSSETIQRESEGGDGDGGSDGESSTSSTRSSTSGYTGSDIGTHGDVMSGFTLVNGSETTRSSRESTPPISPIDDVQAQLQKLAVEEQQQSILQTEIKIPGDFMGTTMSAITAS